MAKTNRSTRSTTTTTTSTATATASVHNSHNDSTTRLLCGRHTFVSERVCSRFVFWFSLAVLVYACFLAFIVRFLSVRKYGYLIHEFDPWFQYRATKYLSTNGWRAFFRWFDDQSWYPIGRPVGTTVYPGLPLTAAGIHWLLQHIDVLRLPLSHVCVLTPAWFGVLATVMAGLLAYELNFRVSSLSTTSFIFCILPAHLMRSMAGEFDNECIAVAAMLFTFYWWIRSLRTSVSWPLGVLTGVAYGYMVSAWGGYIFVLNLIALHAGVMALMDWFLFPNTYDRSVFMAYTLFYGVGTTIAVCVPPVGWTPFQSLEQLPALAVWLLLLSLHIAEWIRHTRHCHGHGLPPTDGKTNTISSPPVRSLAVFKIRASVLLSMLTLVVGFSAVLAPTGYFGPVSSRVRALFVRHTLTGNPLVDSVAEHRPSDDGAYAQWLSWTALGWLVGVLWWTSECLIQPLWRQLTVVSITGWGHENEHDALAGPKSSLQGRDHPHGPQTTRTPSPHKRTGGPGGQEDSHLRPFHCHAKMFILLYAISAFYFSLRMSRLMLLAGPVASIATGHVMGEVLHAAVHAFFWPPPSTSDCSCLQQERSTPSPAKSPQGQTNKTIPLEPSDVSSDLRGEAKATSRGVPVSTGCGSRHPILWLLLCNVGAVLVLFLLLASGFSENNFHIADQLAQPVLVFEAMVDSSSPPASSSSGTRGSSGDGGHSDAKTSQKRVMISDYLDAYLWLRDHTPKDARVLAWWDYGYHISGISERTTLADGNTWNHEHIAMIGKLLTAPIRESHALVRHVADYVLIWAGPDATDLHKSAHMARIANSVFHDVCPEDPLCESFGFIDHRLDMPTASMQRSLLYHLHFDGFMIGARVPAHLFREVYTSKYGLVRIFKVMNVSQESKEWVSSHRLCHSTKPGEDWICPGNYPPSPEMDALLAKRHDFSQLEDFNRGGRNDTYYRAYMEKLRQSRE